MIAVVLMLAAGLALRGLFCGVRTGFYRLNRLRLVLDALGGDFVARGLLALANFPAIFVYTLMLGEQLAGLLCAAALVEGARLLFPQTAAFASGLAVVLFGPLLFVYGELAPQALFAQAPNRLLRLGGPPLLLAAVLLLPFTFILWLCGQVVGRVFGESPQRSQLGIARRELSEVFEEREGADQLRPAQRGLAQGLFAVADQPVQSFVMPAARVPRVRQGSSREEIIRLAGRQRLPALPVEDAARRLVGYVRVIDLHLDQALEEAPLRPLVVIAAEESYLGALTKLETSTESLAQVVNAQGQTIGFLTARHLTEPLFRAQ